MILFESLMYDPQVESCQIELESLVEEYALVREQGEDTSSLAVAILEAEKKMVETQRVSLLKKIRNHFARFKSAVKIADKYGSKALANPCIDLTVKIFKNDKAIFANREKYYTKKLKEVEAILKKTYKKLDRLERKEVLTDIKRIEVELSKFDSKKSESGLKYTNAKVEVKVTKQMVKSAYNYLKKDLTVETKTLENEFKKNYLAGVKSFEMESGLEPYVRRITYIIQATIAQNKLAQINQAVYNAKTIILAAASSKTTTKRVKVEESADGFDFSFSSYSESGDITSNFMDSLFNEADIDY